MNSSSPGHVESDFDAFWTISRLRRICRVTGFRLDQADHSPTLQNLHVSDSSASGHGFAPVDGGILTDRLLVIVDKSAPHVLHGPHSSITHWLQTLASFKLAGHAFPDRTFGRTTVRDRLNFPSTHDVDHCDHSETVQSEQATVWGPGHPAPPACGDFITFGVRLSDVPSQVLQADHVYWQSAAGARDVSNLKLEPQQQRSAKKSLRLYSLPRASPRESKLTPSDMGPC